MIIRQEPAHTEWHTTVVRDDCFHPRIMQAYDAVERHVTAEGLTRGAPVREIYLADFHDVAGGDAFVLVAQPVTDPAAR